MKRSQIQNFLRKKDMHRIMILILVASGLFFYVSCNRNSQNRNESGNSTIRKKWKPQKLKWIFFDISAGENKKGSIKDHEVFITQAKPPDENMPFGRDYLKLEIEHPKKGKFTRKFRSSYARGKVTIVKNLLILQWGRGRGPNARTKNIKLFQLNNGITNLMNVQKSYILLADSENLKAKEVEYSLQIKRRNKSAKIIFKNNSDEGSLPQKKTIIIN